MFYQTVNWLSTVNSEEEGMLNWRFSSKNLSFPFLYNLILDERRKTEQHNLQHDVEKQRPPKEDQLQKWRIRRGIFIYHSRYSH